MIRRCFFQIDNSTGSSDGTEETLCSGVDGWVDTASSEPLTSLEGGLTRSKLGMVRTRSTGGGGEGNSSRETGDFRSTWANGKSHRVGIMMQHVMMLYDI